jgi:hypothetical protein
MLIEYRTMDEAERRLASRDPLTADEARALFSWLVPLHHALPRVQLDLAVQQIEAIERFNDASARLTRVSIWLVALQTFATIAALAISVVSLLTRAH